MGNGEPVPTANPTPDEPLDLDETPTAPGISSGIEGDTLQTDPIIQVDIPDIDEITASSGYALHPIPDTVIGEYDPAALIHEAPTGSEPNFYRGVEYYNTELEFISVGGTNTPFAVRINPDGIRLLREDLDEEGFMDDEIPAQLQFNEKNMTSPCTGQVDSFGTWSEEQFIVQTDLEAMLALIYQAFEYGQKDLNDPNIRAELFAQMSNFTTDWTAHELSHYKHYENNTPGSEAVQYEYSNPEAPVFVFEDITTNEELHEAALYAQDHVQATEDGYDIDYNAWFQEWADRALRSYQGEDAIYPCTQNPRTLFFDEED